MSLERKVICHDGCNQDKVEILKFRLFSIFAVFFTLFLEK